MAYPGFKKGRGGGGGEGFNVVLRSDTGGATSNDFWTHHKGSTAENKVL